MRSIWFILLWICPLTVFPLFGVNDYCFSHVTCENGLSQSNVKAIVQDRDGFIWLGTKNGLNRFDGKTIERKICEDKGTQKENQNISALCAGRDGILWIGTDKGVFRYDPLFDEFSFFDLHTSEGIGIDGWVLNIVEERDGSVWIVVPDQGVFRCQENRLYLYDLQADGQQIQDCPPSHLYVRHNGEVWLSTWGAGLFCYDKVHDRFFRHASDDIGQQMIGVKTVMMCDDGRDIILGTHEGHLLKYSPERRMLEEIKCPELQNTYIRCLCFVDGKIWVGTYRGIFIVDGNTGETKRLLHREADVQSLSDNVIYTMYADSDSGLWIGTMYGGVDYLPRMDFHCTQYMTRDAVRFPDRIKVRGMATDTSGNIWIGTENEGIYTLDVARGVLTRLTSGVWGKQTVLSMSYAENKIYCGIFQNGMWVIDPSDGSVVRHSSESLNINHEDIYAFHIDRQGYRWIGTDRGLYRAKPGTLDFRKVDAVGKTWVFCLFETREGNLWIGTMGDGLFVYEPGRGTCRKYVHEHHEQHSIGSNTVTSIMQTRAGVIWISTERGGLCRYNPEQDDFSVFSVKEGLPDDVVYSVLEDSHGMLWFGTNRGLVCWDEEHVKHVLTTANGLPDNQFNYHAGVVGQDGRLFFGTVGGMLALDRGTEKERASSPLYFTKLTVNNVEVGVGGEDSPLFRSILYTDRIELPYDKANIGLSASLLTYPGTFATRYFYRMEPLGEEWMSASDNHIVYAGLSSGSYKLQVKAIDGYNGNEVVRELSVVILPPWWRTSWAYLFYFLMIFCMAWIVISTYKKRQERRLRIRQRFLEMEKQKEVYEAKMNFFTWVASDVHVPLSPQGQKKPEQSDTKETFVSVLQNVKGNEKEQEWARQVVRVIEENLMDETFNIEAMAEILCMSRSTLLRKVKQVFDCSPVDLVRMLRLKKAATLIQEGGYRISDIGYMVGFNSASYFSKNFQKQFGMSPKDFAKQCRESADQSK